jgi:hypothetical protein
MFRSLHWRSLSRGYPEKKKMKSFFRYFLIVVGFFLLLFLLAGVVKPTIEYDNGIIVSATPEASFSAFKDTSLMKLWITGLTRFEYLEGSMDVPGSKWKLHLNQDGKLYEMTETLTVYEENRRFAFLLHNEVLESETDIRFTPSNQGTIITVHNKVTGNNLLFRSLFVLTGSYFRAESQKMYDNLKLLIDKSQVPA